MEIFLVGDILVVDFKVVDNFIEGKEEESLYRVSVLYFLIFFRCFSLFISVRFV